MSDVTRLEDQWRELESGVDMTYFQTYDWYEMLCNLNAEIHDNRFEVKIFVVERNAKVVLIAPLWIVKKTFGKYNRKGFYFFGRGGWSDYLNFIYRDFDEMAVDYLLNYLKNNYNISDFYLENILETTRLYDYLISGDQPKKITSQVCVGLSIGGSSFDDYNKALSKQSRQNIRTARNRLSRDGKTLVYNLDDKNIDLNEFMSYRSIRVEKKNEWSGKTIKWRIFNYVSTRILHRGWYKFVDYAPYTHDANSRFMTAKTTEGELCAAFNYGISPDGRSIVLMGVSTNPAYFRYSPGILLLCSFIEDAIESHRYDYIDFTRGNESYKYHLGGKDHFISNFVLNLKELH